MAQSTVKLAAQRTQTPAGELHDIREVAARLNCGRTLAYKLIVTGALPAIKLGRLTRVCDADLEQFVARLREDAAWLM